MYSRRNESTGSKKVKYLINITSNKLTTNTTNTIYPTYPKNIGYRISDIGYPDIGYRISRISDIGYPDIFFFQMFNLFRPSRTICSGNSQAPGDVDR